MTIHYPHAFIYICFLSAVIYSPLDGANTNHYIISCHINPPIPCPPSPFSNTPLFLSLPIPPSIPAPNPSHPILHTSGCPGVEWREKGTVGNSKKLNGKWEGKCPLKSGEKRRKTAISSALMSREVSSGNTLGHWEI